MDIQQVGKLYAPLLRSEQRLFMALVTPHDGAVFPRARPLKKWRRWMLVLFLPACFVLWFLTAPACFAIERIGAGNNISSRLIISAASAYETPMIWLRSEFSLVRQYDDRMTDWWCDVMDAPETTP